jgi:hypothetical protein
VGMRFGLASDLGMEQPDRVNASWARIKALIKCLGIYMDDPPKILKQEINKN